MPSPADIRATHGLPIPERPRRVAAVHRGSRDRRLLQELGMRAEAPVRVRRLSIKVEP